MISKGRKRPCTSSARWRFVACFAFFFLCAVLPAHVTAQEVAAEHNGWLIFDDFEAIAHQVIPESVCTLPEIPDREPGMVDPMRLRVQDGMTAQRQTRATTEFEIDYQGFTGTDGERAREAFQRAAGIWATHIASDIPITIRAIFEERDEDDVLASAGPGRFYSGTVQSPRGGSRQLFFPVALANNLVGEDLEADQDDTVPHIRVRINSEVDWYYGDGTPGTNEFDFVSVILHELGHGLGFVGSMTVDEDEEEGLYPFSRESQEQFGIPLIYDLFVRDGQNGWLADEPDFPNPSRKLMRALEGERDGLFFEGDETLRANVFEPAELYAPQEWNPGSSYSHLDQRTYPAGDVNSLMTPRIAREEVIQSPGAITCGMFSDMFWAMGPNCILLLEEDLLAFSARTDPDQAGRAIVEWVIERVGDIARMTLEHMYRDAPPPLREFTDVLTVEADDVEHPTVVGVDDQSISYQAELDNLPPGRHVFRLRSQRLDGTDFTSQEFEVTIQLIGEEFVIRGPYPNPADQQSRVDVTLPEGQFIYFYLYDANGREVQRSEINARSNIPETFTIQASHLSSGVYYLRIVGNALEETTQLVIVR